MTTENRREYYQRRRQTPEYREQSRRWREANAARISAYRRQRKHGRDIAEVFSAMWQAQDGRCYLCREPLVRERAVIDHDHAHCAPETSCSYCRRGLTCNLCNVVIGMAHENPQLLRKIADNLEAVLDMTRLRIAGAPCQETLHLQEAQ